MKFFKAHPEEIIAAVLIGILVLLSGYIYFFKTANNNEVEKAEVIKLNEIKNDGGFNYQYVEVEIKNPKFQTAIKIPITDPKLEKISVGSSIYVKKISTSLGENFNFAGFRRVENVKWMFLIFFVLLLVMLGKVGLKYIIAAFLFSIIVASGTFSFFTAHFNIYLVSFGFISVIAFTSILLQFKNFKIAIIVTLAQIFTLVLILLMNLVLFRISILTEIFYSQVRYLEQSISIYEYWALANVGVIFLAFGTTLNTTYDVVSSIILKKKKYPTSTVTSLLEEGTQNSQIIGGRVINNMFFVMLGISLLYITFFDSSKYFSFFDDPFVTQNIILFINASLAALLIAPITSLISVIYLASQKQKSQLEII
jgi:uncharacterized membrane protein